MGKSLLYGVFGLILLFFAATSRSDVGPAMSNVPGPPAAAGDEPITGSPAASAAGSETLRHDPFTRYDIGAPGTKGWSYRDLRPDEKAYSDRVRQAPIAARTADGFAAAVKERAQHAGGNAAASMLGIDNLASTGVVP